MSRRQCVGESRVSRRQAIGDEVILVEPARLCLDTGTHQVGVLSAHDGLHDEQEEHREVVDVEERVTKRDGEEAELTGAGADRTSALELVRGGMVTVTGGELLGEVDLEAPHVAEDGNLTSSRMQNMSMTGRETAADVAFACSVEVDAACSVVLEPSSERTEEDLGGCRAERSPTRWSRIYVVSGSNDTTLEKDYASICTFSRSTVSFPSRG